MNDQHTTKRQTITRNNNETISTMLHEETSMTIDANVDTITATEPLDTGHVENAPIVAVSRPKKSKRASSRNVRKRGSLVDDDTFSPPTLSIDNDSSDNVVETSDIPLEPTDCATNVPNDAAVLPVPLDELFDYDYISVQVSVPDNELEPQPSTSDPTQRVPNDIELVHSTEPSKKRKLDMGDLMVRSNVTKRVGSGKSLSQFKAPKWPEITRLPPIDDTETGAITTVKARFRPLFC